MDKSWYGVRCIFKLLDADVYEERVVLWHEEDVHAAIAAAEKDAEWYAETLNMQYLGLCQTYRLPDAELTSGSEAFSLMRESKDDPPSYLNKHYNTGTELQNKNPDAS